MGRITIFTTKNCVHSLRVKDALESRRIPYAEICISQYPRKRIDMIHLCGRYSVPQVFFNTRHVGGADETIQQLKDWDRTSYCTPLERYEFEIGSRPEPSNPLLSCCEEEATVEPVLTATALKARENSAENFPISRLYSKDALLDDDRNTNETDVLIPLPDGTNASFRQVTETLKSILQMESIQHNNLIYKNCFSGKSLVKAVMFRYDNLVNQSDAEAFCTQLLNKGRNKVLCRVTMNNDQDKDDIAREDQEEEFANGDDSYYRLQCYHTPDILNTYRNYWGSSSNHKRLDCSEKDEPFFITTTKRVNSLMLRLFALMEKIESNITSRKGQINYKMASQDEINFPLFEETVCELQRVDFSSIQDSRNKIAFALNVYNLMLKYAFMKVGLVSCSDSSPSVLLQAVKFNVGGDIFSLHDWFHGVIRGNRAIGYSRIRRRQNEYFRRSDSRKQRFAVNSSMEDDFDSTSHSMSSSSHSASCSSINLISCSISTLVHFGILSRFSWNSPPFSYFTMNKDLNSTLREELLMMSLAFCEHDINVSVSYKEKKVTLSNIFRTYRSDFQSTAGRTESNGMNELLLTVDEFLSGEKRIQFERLLDSKEPMQVSFKDQEADWTTNAGDYIPFQISNITTTATVQNQRWRGTRDTNGSKSESDDDDNIIRRVMKTKSDGSKGKSTQSVPRCRSGSKALQQLRATIRGKTHSSKSVSPTPSSSSTCTKNSTNEGDGRKASRTTSAGKSLAALRRSLMGNKGKVTKCEDNSMRSCSNNMTSETLSQSSSSFSLDEASEDANRSVERNPSRTKNDEMSLVSLHRPVRKSGSSKQKSDSVTKSKSGNLLGANNSRRSTKQSQFVRESKTASLLQEAFDSFEDLDLDGYDLGVGSDLESSSSRSRRSEIRMREQ